MGDDIQHFGRRSSLRVRLPLFFAVPVVFVLASFLWLTNRQVEHALVEAGRQRADLAANELARTLGTLMQRVAEQTVAIADSPAVRSFVLDTSSVERSAVIAAISTSPQQPLRRSEILDASGALLLLDSAGTADDTVASLRAFPPTDVPLEPGVSPFAAIDTFQYFVITAAIRADSASPAPIGYLRRFTRLSSRTSDLISGFMGEGASFRIGTIGQPVWTDMVRALEVPASWDFSAERFWTEDGQPLVGEIAVVHGTPWVVWVGFPRSIVVAPAEPFMRRMALASLLLVAAGVMLVALLGYRLTRPVRALADTADRISAGDLSRRVEIHRHDEIGQLGVAFNTMVDHVQAGHRALEEANERVQFALATAGIAIWAVDLDTGAMSVSESMKLIHPAMTGEGIRRREDFLALVDEASRPALQRVLEGDDRGKDSHEVRYRTRDDAGADRFIEGKAQLVRDGSGRPRSIIAVSIDVTERQRLQSQLVQSQKMEGIGQLAGGIAHDFNNLLTAILGHANLLLDELPEDSDLREDLVGIIGASESAAALTRQLLTFSRKRLTEPSVIDVNDYIAKTERLLRRLIGEHVAIDTRLDPDVDPVLLDPANFEQILVNLAVNARDAMPAGGRLTLSTTNVQIGPDFYSEGAEVDPGTYVMISVTDTGVGMDETTRAHLFEPFFTTKPVGRGTGLGLATVFGIVKQAGGHIFVYSEPGHGSVFKLYFPAARGQRRDERPAPVPDVSAHAGSETILVVEDNAHVREVVQNILERSNYQVLTASNGEEALAAIARLDQAPDLVLSDVIMPGMTGPELRDRLVAVHPGIRVIFTSGYAGEALAHHDLDTGNMLEKPYSPSDLTRKVRETLDRSRPLRTGDA